jgi:hypothetical protein
MAVGQLRKPAETTGLEDELIASILVIRSRIRTTSFALTWATVRKPDATERGHRDRPSFDQGLEAGRRRGRRRELDEI